MNKTISMVAVAMLIVASISLAQAQDGKAHRVGVLSIVDTPVLKGLRDGLKEIGYDRRDDSAERARESG